MLDACEVGGGAEVDDHLGIAVCLQERSRDGVAHLALDGFLDDAGLLLAPGHDEHALGLEDGAHAHGQAAGRHLLTVGEAVGHLLTRKTVNEDDVGVGSQTGTGLVDSDVAAAADAKQSQVETAEGLNALLVEAAVVLHGIL